jgi:hypothetical protein
MILICINTAREALFPLTIISDPVTRRIFRDNVEENAQLNVHVGHSGHMNVVISQGYLRNIFIILVKNCRKAKEIPDFILMLFFW